MVGNQEQAPPPTHSQLGTTQRRSHPLVPQPQESPKCAEASLEGGPRKDFQSRGAPWSEGLAL